MLTNQVRGQAGRVELRFDVGTLWTLELDAHVARCALVWLPDQWELRVSIDDQALLSERCRDQAEVFQVAGSWRSRLCGRGWGPGRLADAADSYPC